MLIWLILFILVVIMYQLQSPDTIMTNGMGYEQVGGLIRRGHYPLRRGWGWGWPWGWRIGWPWGWRWKYRRYHPHHNIVITQPY